MRTLLLSALLACLLLFPSIDARRWKFGGKAGAGIGLQIDGLGEEGEEGDPCEPAAASWARDRPCGEKTLLSGPEVEQLSQEQFG